MRFVEDVRSDLPHHILMMLSNMASELATIIGRFDAIDAEIKTLARADTDMQRLMEIPGAGLTIFSVFLAAVGTCGSFAKGCDLTGWLGPVPGHVTTGGRAKLIGISKHGNRYLRKLFIHGARTVLHLVRNRTSPIMRWADDLKGRAHVNVAAVAMANKMARIAWAVLTKGERYRSAALVGQHTG